MSGELEQHATVKTATALFLQALAEYRSRMPFNLAPLVQGIRLANCNHYGHRFMRIAAYPGAVFSVCARCQTPKMETPEEYFIRTMNRLTKEITA